MRIYKQNMCLGMYLITSFAQVSGAFHNLDFESANVAEYSPINIIPIPTDNALPDWSAYYDGSPTSYVWYDTSSLGSSVIAINDNKREYGFIPLEGNFSVGIEGRRGSASIGQTGLIPDDSLSVVFLFRNVFVGTLEVSFKGQALPWTIIDSGTDHDVYAADISQYAGQTGELRFTEYFGGAIIDDIQFSPNSVPEPGIVSLIAIGALAMVGRFAWRRS